MRLALRGLHRDDEMMEEARGEMTDPIEEISETKEENVGAVVDAVDEVDEVDEAEEVAVLLNRVHRWLGMRLRAGADKAKDPHRLRDHHLDHLHRNRNQTSHCPVSSSRRRIK